MNAGCSWPGAPTWQGQEPLNGQKKGAGVARRPHLKQPVESYAGSQAASSPLLRLRVM